MVRTPSLREAGLTAGRPTRSYSSSQLFEVAQAETADNGRLDARDVAIDLVGAKRGTHDGARCAGALRLTDELGNGLCDIVRLRRVLALEHRHEGLEHCV